MAIALDLRATSPIATRSEVSALLSVPGPRLTAWARPSPGKSPLVHTYRATGNGRLTYPLVGIAEASTLNALRIAGMSLQHIRGAVSYIRDEHQEEFALASPKFVTDGTEAYLHDHVGLTRLRDRQFAFREVIKDYLRPLVIGPDGFVEAFTVERFASPVTVDPRFNAGQMSFVRNRIPLFAVVGPLTAGEHESIVCEDFGLTEAEVSDVKQNLSWLTIFG